METTRVHAIGKCPVRGCRNRKRITLAGRIVRDRHGVHTDWSMPTRVGGQHPAPTYAPVRPSNHPTKDVTDAAFVEAMVACGWTCVEHDRFMIVNAVKGIVNYDKPCTARCKSATGPNCECVCGGEGHGSTFA